MRAGEGFLSWLPLAHQFQRMTNWVAMSVGAVIHFVDDPRAVVERAREVRPGVLIGVPRFYEKLAEGFRSRLSGLPGVGRWAARALDRALRLKSLGNRSLS
ncbi:MAG: AMP-binding protein [Elusimicrobia bacterium]|nr:AMP-binding protein [Elusimicrobiota bacterium]